MDVVKDKLKDGNAEIRMAAARRRRQMAESVQHHD